VETLLFGTTKPRMLLRGKTAKDAVLGGQITNHALLFANLRRFGTNFSGKFTANRSSVTEKKCLSFVASDGIIDRL